jgi:hypothetical protein
MQKKHKENMRKAKMDFLRGDGGAECLFSWALAIGRTGASMGRYKNSLKNLLNFYFLAQILE